MSKFSNLFSKKDSSSFQNESDAELFSKEEEILPPMEEPPISNMVNPSPAQEEKPKKWKFPNLEQWKFLVNTLSLKEKKIILLALFCVWCLIASWGMLIYIKDTDKKPALGGFYTEGVVGQPLYINPILSASNPVDSDLSLLIFSSLFRYNKDGKIDQDLVDKWTRSEDGLVYNIDLKKNAKWQDGNPLTVEDIVFTLNLIRNPSFNSTLRGNWEGIQVEKIDDYKIRFTLKKAYTPFLHNLTFGILPKHLWEKIGSENFLLTELNKKPLGSGMYSFSKLEKDKEGKIISITLRANPEYYGSKPHLKEVSFNFYSSSSDVITAYEQNEIQGIGQIENNQLEKVKTEKGLKIYPIPTTRVYAVFLNQQKSAVLADQNVREALNYATNKEELLSGVLLGQGIAINAPLLPNMPGYDPALGKYEYSIEKAKSKLKEAGFEELSEKDAKKLKDDLPQEGGNILYNTKTKQFLSINLSVPDYPELVKTAEILKSQWEKAGVYLNVETMDTSETLQNRIGERNYEALLFGEVFQADPDPTPFWHSGSKQSPGLNLSLFDDPAADKLLDQARQEVNEETKAQLYRDFEQLVINKSPVVFLFSPYYLYGISEDYKGIGTKVIYNQSNRLNDINERYLFTSRTRR